MLVLGVDTSTPVAGVGLVNEDGLVGEVELKLNQTHSERLISIIDRLLSGADLKINDIDGFAVAVGPGSFTGLRIGMGTMMGLAQALKKPLAGVSTLAALAFRATGTGDLVCPVVTARKNEIYAAFYRINEGIPDQVSEYLALPPDELFREAEKFSGRITFTGPAASTVQVAMDGKEKNFTWLPPIFCWPNGSSIAFVGRSKILKGEEEGFSNIKPIYIRPSQAEILWEKRQAKRGHR